MSADYRKFQKGQAIAEMAILGSLILVAFSTLLVYGQRLELQQKIKMEAFRNALSKAYQSNNAVSYTLKRDLRLTNLFSGFGEGDASALSASASVMWQKGSPGSQGSDDEQSFAFYQINDNIIGDGRTGLPRDEKKIITKTGKKQEIWSPVSIWKEDSARVAKYDSSVEKNEDTAGIKNTQTSDLQETVRTTLYTRFDKAETDNRYIPGETGYVYPEYEDKGHIDSKQGAYLDSDSNRIKYGQENVGRTVHRERTWQTNK